MALTLPIITRWVELIRTGIQRVFIFDGFPFPWQDAPKTVFEFVNRMALRDMSLPHHCLRLHVGRETLVSSWENTWTSVETSLTIVSSLETHVSHVWNKRHGDATNRVVVDFTFILISKMSSFSQPFEVFLLLFLPIILKYFLSWHFFSVTNFSANWCKELQSLKRHHSRPESILNSTRKKVSGYWLRKLLLNPKL